MKPRRNFGPDRQTIAQGRAQLHRLLLGCRDAALDAFTVEMLAHSYRVPPKEAECMLLAEKGKRARLREGRA